MNIKDEEFAKARDAVLESALPEFLEDGAVRIHYMLFHPNTLVAAAFRNYRDANNERVIGDREVRVLQEAAGPQA